MNKPFLLIAGAAYYPSCDTGDWVACFSTYEEAKEQVEEVQYHEYFTKGKRKGELKSTHTSYIIKNVGKKIGTILLIFMSGLNDERISRLLPLPN